MAATSAFKDVDLHCDINNVAHRTSEVSTKMLIARRGQPFTMTVTLNEPFKDAAQPLFILVNMGDNVSEERGTLCKLSVPDVVPRSPNAKAVWTVEQDRKSNPLRGVLVLNFTPPADAPIGEFSMMANYGASEKLLAKLALLFNPWCPEDAVFMRDERQRQEYVMNEHGKIYRGSKDYIMDLDWDFGQFEENMVEICLSMLNISNEHRENPEEDLGDRADPGYIGRIISAMINSEDDYGVLEGRWGWDYSEGRKPTHWTGSSAILSQWLRNGFGPVKYGQCWVFAGVMCTVMRFLGVPCRVVTNFESAHDTDANLTIDRFRAEEGAMWMNTHDSVWNFHVWVEGWMKRPDIDPTGSFDGWQVLDPTPQEESGGVYRCGPTPKYAILNGVMNVKYDIPFVFAEVNADINVWLTKADYSMEKIESYSDHVGHNISTKAEGTELRDDITNTYKPREGTFSERYVFSRAVISNFKVLLEKRKKERERRERERRERESATVAASDALEDARMNGESTTEEASFSLPTDETPSADAVSGGTEPRPEETAEIFPPSRERNETLLIDGALSSTAPSTEETEEEIPPPPRVTMKFEEVTKPMNGQDVEMNLVLSSESTTDRPLVIVIEANTMQYFGLLTSQILRKPMMETLTPGKPLLIPIVIPFSDYSKPMLNSDSMKISALVLDRVKPHHPYIKECNVVLLDPPLHVTLLGEARLFKPTTVEVVFMNPVNETLENCTLTISGSGLEKGEFETPIQDILPSRRIRVRLRLFPYKVGLKTLTVDLDSSVFRDIKGKCTIEVKP